MDVNAPANANAPKPGEKFDAVLVEAVSAACEHFKHPVKLSAPKPAGPIADSVLIPAKTLLEQLVVTQGPKAVDFVIDFLRSKIPF